MTSGVHYGASVGNRTAVTTATTPADARADAAWIKFSDAPQISSVDTTRSAGFKVGGTMYCVAPILSAQAFSGGDASTIRVSYWAVGIDCCNHAGVFSCDAS